MQLALVAIAYLGGYIARAFAAQEELSREEDARVGEVFVGPLRLLSSTQLTEGVSQLRFAVVR